MENRQEKLIQLMFVLVICATGFFNFVVCMTIVYYGEKILELLK